MIVSFLPQMIEAGFRYDLKTAFFMCFQRGGVLFADAVAQAERPVLF